MMYRLHAVLAIVIAAGVPGTPAAQEATPPESPRIAVVDLFRILQESTPGKALLERLENEEAAKKKELRVAEVDILTLEERIRTSPQRGLSAERVEELKQDYEKKLTEYRRQAMEAEREFTELQNKQFQEIEKDIQPILEEITKEQKLDIIFDRPQSGIIYMHQALDITGEVLKRLEARIIEQESAQPPAESAKPEGS
ncbi:MAG: OmpH family outer membrane protein [Acidobacteriota bacterium]|nr:MAG: OmpH family outer membrane protein [Acidobacteriota bacterium]